MYENAIIILAISFILMSTITSSQFYLPRLFLYTFYIISFLFIPNNIYVPTKKDNTYNNPILLSLGTVSLILATELAINSDILKKPLILLGILLFLFIKNVFFIKYVLQKIETKNAGKNIVKFKRQTTLYKS